MAAALRNVSLAGVSCTTDQPFAEMTQLMVRLELPPLESVEEEGPVLELLGAVVRCQPHRRGSARRRFEVAIYFTDLSDQARQSLEKFIRERLDADD